ncbi:MAG: hypothetical protein RL701_5609, partial [Pseudomonadota bacterium]
MDLGSNKSRKDTRAVVSLVARYRSPSTFEYVQEACCDVSLGGMFIQSQDPAAAGTLLKLECEADRKGTKIRGVARVVWLRREPNEYGPSGMGVKFVKLEPGSKEIIMNVVQELAAAGIHAASISSAPENRGKPPATPRPPDPPVVEAIISDHAPPPSDSVRTAPVVDVQAERSEPPTPTVVVAPESPSTPAAAKSPAPASPAASFDTRPRQHATSPVVPHAADAPEVPPTIRGPRVVLGIVAIVLVIGLVMSGLAKQTPRNRSARPAESPAPAAAQPATPAQQTATATAPSAPPAREPAVPTPANPTEAAPPPVAAPPASTPSGIAEGSSAPDSQAAPPASAAPEPPKTPMIGGSDTGTPTPAATIGASDTLPTSANPSP